MHGRARTISNGDVKIDLRSLAAAGGSFILGHTVHVPFVYEMCLYVRVRVSLCACLSY